MATLTDPQTVVELAMAELAREIAASAAADR